MGYSRLSYIHKRAVCIHRRALVESPHLSHMLCIAMVSDPTFYYTQIESNTPPTCPGIGFEVESPNVMVELLHHAWDIT